MDTYKIVGKEVYQLTGKCQSEKCDSWCCRHLVLHIKTAFPDDPKYYSYHGIVKKADDKSFWFMTYKECSQLNIWNHQCTIHDTKPTTCKRYAQMPNDAFCSPDCTLSWKQVTGRQAQIILSKSKSSKQEDVKIFV